MELALLIANRLWSNIKSYQSEAASQHSPSQNSLSYCNRLLVYKRILFDLVYIPTECSGFTDWMAWRALLTHQMDKKESMGLVGFEDPLRGEKKLLLEQENLDSMLS